MLSSLEAHWHVLEAEVVEINRDIDYCEQCLRKYGEWFNSPLQYLRVCTSTQYPRLALRFPAGTRACRYRWAQRPLQRASDKEPPLLLSEEICSRADISAGKERELQTGRPGLSG